MTSRAILLLSACFVLAGADSPVGLLAVVTQQTAAAQQALAALPASCSRGAASSLQQARTQLFANVASCSVSAIIKDIAYIMIDAADFGSAAWGDGVELVADVKACLNETSLLEKVECVADALANTSAPVQGLMTAVEQLVEQLIVIIPDIESQIKACQDKSTTEYQTVLNELVNKAKAC